MKQTLGVAVMRMQVAAPTEGHLHLLRTIQNTNDVTQLYIGDRTKNSGSQNPLPWQARAQMIRAYFPDLQVAMLPDQPENAAWSDALDNSIQQRWPGYVVTLYCSRDGFKAAYSGRFPVVVVEPIPSQTGTEQRRAILENGPVSDELFRQGMVYSAMQRYPTVYSTVDVALLSAERTHVLLGQKTTDGDKWRFIGGFVDPSDQSRLAAAKRELREEVGAIEIDWVGHIDSVKINDWRYRDEPDSIMTDLFLAIYIFGKLKANDDLSQVEWFPVTTYQNHLIEAHQPLADRLQVALSNL